MNWRDLLKRVLKWAFFAVLAVGLAEVSVRAIYAIRGFAVSDKPEPYVFGHTYATYPPWVDSMRMLRFDRRLVWKMRPGMDRDFVDIFSPAPSNEEWLSAGKRFFPKLPDWAEDNPVWNISINSAGFRDDEFRDMDPTSSFRVVCVGASWTFGSNIGQDDPYPQQLEARLKSRFPGADVDVVNMGVAGYSSYQGLELVKTTVLGLDPDVVVISFGGVDGQLSGWRDRDALIRSSTPRARVRGVLMMLELPKLVHYVVKRFTTEDELLGKRLRTRAARAERTHTVDIDRLLQRSVRVPPDEYETNIREMIRLTREHGAEPVLLFTDLEGQAGLPGPLEIRYWGRLEEISASQGVPLVDTRPIIADAQRAARHELEERLDLVPGDEPAASDAPGVELVFRVLVDRHEVPEAIYIAGTHEKLGDTRPNEVVMYDDGTHGDQRAGDRVWSLAVGLSPGADVFYAYTNSGRAGAWEGVDVPHVRELVVAADREGERLFLPIDAFGRVFVQSDSWHPDRNGYGLIADQLLDAMARSPDTRRRLLALQGAPSR
ncbi:MAG: GDSL-type esterase/lipase family protein [Acidobacteriota bacterium]|nr:GDSL-type esterase/lipase family protein [Acidobacteriota bacterium]